MTVAQKGLLALSIVFILGGLGLTIAGVFSPAWQVVDIREFRAEHQVRLIFDLYIFQTIILRCLCCCNFLLDTTAVFSEFTGVGPFPLYLSV